MRRLTQAISTITLLALAGGPVAAQSEEPEVELDKGEVIVVTGSLNEKPLKDSTVATEVITREELVASGAENLSELLEDQSGIQIGRSFRGSSAQIQGLDATYILVLVDGERQIGRIGGGVNLERFSIGEIERVEIVKGASSALYGADAIAGVINIITRKDRAPLTAELHSSYGSFDAVDATARVGASVGRLRTQLSGLWHRRSAYDLRPADAATTSSGFDEYGIRGSASYDAGKATELNLSGEYQRRYTDGIDLGQGEVVFDRRTLTETAGASLRGKTRFGRHRLSGGARYSIFADQFLHDQQNAAELDTFEKTREQLLQLNGQYDVLLGDHLVTAGVEGLVERLTADRLSERGERNRVAAFAQDEWNLASLPRVTVVPGFRVDRDSQFGTHLSPKIAVRVDPHEKLVVRASHGWGFRAPSFRELLLNFENSGVGYRISGNPDLEPETSKSTALNVELRAHDTVWATVGGFYNDVDNLIQFDQVAGDGGMMSGTRFQYVNIASARTAGMESQLRLRPLSGLTAEVGYVFTHTHDRSADRELPGRPSHTATGKLSYRVPAVATDMQLRGRWIGARYFFEDDNGDGAEDRIRAAPYLSLDIRAEQPLLDSTVDLFVGADNLLDAGDADYLPIQPRTFYVGVTARYQ